MFVLIMMMDFGVDEGIVNGWICIGMFIRIFNSYVELCELNGYQVLILNCLECLYQQVLCDSYFYDWSVVEVLVVYIVGMYLVFVRWFFLLLFFINIWSGIKVFQWYIVLLFMVLIESSQFFGYVCYLLFWGVVYVVYWVLMVVVYIVVMVFY